MGKYLIKRINILYLAGFLITVALLITTYINQAYVAIDTTIYTIIGKDIFESFILPYGNTFDHKPIVTYYIYGFFHHLIGQKNLYLLVAFTCCISSAVVVSGKNLNKFLVTSSFILIASVMIENFSGNSEMLMLPFICMYLYFYTSTFSHKFILIGAIAALVFNINYLAALIMMPVTLYMFFSKQNDSSFLRVLKFSIGFLISSVVIFSPFYIANQSVVEYFSLQYQFLTAYSNNKSRIDGIINLSRFIIIFLPIVLLYCYRMNKDESFFVIILLYIGTILGALVSGYGYSHYLEPSVIPLSLMFWQIITSQKKKMILIVLSPLLLSLLYMLPVRKSSLNTSNYINSVEAQEDLMHLNRLASIDNSALNIRSTHIVYLFSNIKNINKYIWRNHPQVMFGAFADDYYINQINKNPHLIMTKSGMCTTSSRVCESILNSYSFDSTSKIEGGYDLYIRKD